MQAPDQQIIQAVISGGLTARQNAAILNIINNRAGSQGGETPLLWNQAQAARQLNASRFTIRRLVKEGKLHPVNITPDLVRYKVSEVQALAAGGLDHDKNIPPREGTAR